MHFDIITIFPGIFDSYFNESIIKRAQEQKIVSITSHNLRNWTDDRHKTVDDTPYGGGAGMVMKIEPLHAALKEIKASHQGRTLTVLLPPKGEKWTQEKAQTLKDYQNIILICGRYEGVDERITHFIDEQISIGDYVLTGGEIGAMVIVDSLTRLLPGALGNEKSATNESHSEPGLLEYPQYTRPSVFNTEGQSYPVPDILLSGNHAAIEKWRKDNMKKIS